MAFDLQRAIRAKERVVCPTCKRLIKKAVRKVRAGKPRRGPMRDPKYRRWCHWQQCVLGPMTIGRCADYGEPAHTENNGMRSKGRDSSCVPLCRKHHEEQHKIGMPTFNAKYGVDLRKLAAEHYARYLAEGEREHMPVAEVVER